MPTNLSAWLGVEVAAVLQGIAQGRLAVVEAVLDALVEQPLDLVDRRGAERLADAVGAQRQRQAGPLLPPDAEIDDQLADPGRRR